MVIKKAFLLIQLMGLLSNASDPTVAGVGGSGRPAPGIHAKFLALHLFATQIWGKLFEIN